MGRPAGRRLPANLPRWARVDQNDGLQPPLYRGDQAPVSYREPEEYTEGSNTSVVSLKFIEEQPQIPRLTTPELKDVRGPVRSVMTTNFVLRISDSGH